MTGAHHHPARASRAVCLALAALALGACGSEQTKTVKPILTVTGLQQDFGEVPVLLRKETAFELTNDGLGPLTVSRVAIKEEGTPFSVLEAPAGVPDRGAAPVRLAFAPLVLGEFTATLVIESDDEEQPQWEATLHGKSTTAAKMAVDPTLDFGEVCEGAQPIRSVVVRSSGTADLVLNEIRFKEGSAPEFGFAASARTPATVGTGSQLDLAIRFAPTPATPDTATATLVLVGSDPERPAVEIALRASVNRAPVATIAPIANPAPGSTVILDGSGSTDADGDLPLTWAWALKASPLGSRAKPTPADAEQSSLTVDLAGQYTVELRVRDAAGCASAPASLALVAKSAKQLVVELVWNNPDTDLDLHLAPEAEVPFGPLDCYFAEGHQSPDWGRVGDDTDNPTLDRDALTGFGPELIGYASPAAEKYVARVHFYSDHNSKNPPTIATLRVYEFGALKAELSRRLDREGQLWTALSIDWPSGAIGPIDVVE